MPSNHLIFCRPLLLPPSIFPSITVFSNESVLQSGGRSVRVSASTSVFPMNTQDWSPLGRAGLISLWSKGLSRVFSNTTVQKHQFFSIQLSSQSNSHIHTWLLEKPGCICLPNYPGSSHKKSAVLSKAIDRVSGMWGLCFFWHFHLLWIPHLITSFYQKNRKSKRLGLYLLSTQRLAE